MTNVKEVGVGNLYHVVVDTLDANDTETIFKVQNQKNGKVHGYIKAVNLDDLQDTKAKSNEGITLTNKEGMACLIALWNAQDQLRLMGIPASIVDNAIAPLEAKLSPKW